MNRTFTILFILIIAIAGCRKKPYPSKSGETTVTDTIELNSSEMFNELDFNYFTSKAKLEFSDGKEEVKGKMTIRMKKDSLIWVSIYGSALNIEVMRALVTTDSIFLNDYLNKEYNAYDFSTLSKKIKFNLDFDLAQSLIIGNMPRKKRRSDKFSRGKDYYMIKQQEGYTFIDNYFGSLSNKLEKVEIKDQPANRSLELSYGDFLAVDDKKVFAQSSTLNLKYSEDGKTYFTFLTIKHLKSEFTDKSLEFPFRKQ